MLDLIITQGKLHNESRIEITDVQWIGLRCTVVIEGDFTNLKLDLRLHAGDSRTSVARSVRPFKEDGVASIVVEDENFETRSAFITVIDNQNRLVAQIDTIIGEEDK